MPARAWAIAAPVVGAGWGSRGSRSSNAGSAAALEASFRMMDAYWQVACHAAIPVAHCEHADAIASRAQFADYNVSTPYGLICAPDTQSFTVDADLLASELDTHRRYLLRVAQLQLRDADLAEDVV